ncbi:hypothetical protein F5ESL0236_08290 [Lactobacillus sp. ESL0236]|uniref:conserved phage C-terminal domain-containing protein n=1 Tax=unclassified Lactobacillus TaxID=2620435 RepID=UPI000EFA4389|nr:MULTISPECIES: conserved phage C-terminal domain-containing protein [unclassified Lactobacillus]RMC38144.1 hypothetical protein F5ESL0237_07550 [Lactobacillus sp. ESL0237]RMC42444.1 hypothetical protein F5ESL0234_08190 [Lactobacillus sp. ESL0234]RMC42609.1 hypothetical protein F5ESL0236_08290 [Lactobacillus sp. ESL0236]
MKATWLYSKYPIVIDTELATVIGVNEAIVAQKLNYWLHSKSAKQINGRRWIYNTYDNWKKDSFPFFSKATIRRTLTKLEEQGIVITGNFNKAGFDKTKWYSIDEEKLDELMSRRGAQNEQTRCSERADGSAQNEQTNTIDYTSTTPYKDIYSSAKAEPAIYKEVIDYLNEKAVTKYKSTSKATQRLINARVNDGFDIPDFKKVIDAKCAQWRGDKKMAKYLRPETLFGTKFEGYLNEKTPNVPQHADFAPDAFTNGEIEGVNEDELPF